MNPITEKLRTGSLGELLVQTRLLQYGVQAAPPLKDTGNDLIAVRGGTMRAVQVKATQDDNYAVPDEKTRYHLLAAVHLFGEDNEVLLDRCEIYLIEKEKLGGLSRQFVNIAEFRLTQTRVNELFPANA
jgi:hypothetical protein